ncbi:MAG: hypothetical protein U9N53_12400 [Bacteroidota bacterium]|nr:hypothetical protein [Bacteroidota bacterium]
MSKNNLEKKIIQSLALKSNIKQLVCDNNEVVFSLMKKTLTEISDDFNKQLNNLKERVRLEFTDHGEFIAKLRVAGDMLVFSMHSNIFEFDREHKVWETDYVKTDPLNSYCGIISIYNFLDDSFRYNRMDDLGYLIGRIFVNKNNHFFVEGKRQMGFHFKNFGKRLLDKSAMRSILAKAMAYALEFDLLVPPYDAVKIASVGQMTEKMYISQIKTGKRLGFQFNSDDVMEENGD